MKIRIALIAAIIALNHTLANAQNSREIDRTYSKQADVYVVAQQLWMTPSYSEDGQVCLMRVYPRAVSGKINYPASYLNLSEVLGFINSRFPVNTRGRRRDGFGMSDIGGGIIWTRFNYDNVRFVFISTFDKTNLIADMAKAEPVDLEPVDEAAIAELRKKEDAKSDDQIIRERAFNTNILEIYWPNRKCVF